MSEKLEPCPFCGLPAELEHGNDHHGEWFNLGCSRHWGRVDPDQACVGGRLWYTEFEKPEAEAIAAWNRRFIPTSGGVDLEVLESFVLGAMMSAEHCETDKAAGQCAAVTVQQILSAVPGRIDLEAFSSVACGLSPVSLPVCLGGDATPSEDAE